MIDRMHARAIERACIWREAALMKAILSVPDGDKPIISAECRRLHDAVVEIRKLFGDTDD
jgi:hypothetical protein